MIWGLICHHMNDFSSFLVNEIGINSMQDVVNLDPQKINLRLKSYIEENELKILIPSTRDIEVWQKEIIRLFGK